jgi:UDP-hydrolysing UDP-N-acetyl-D-glucosamine 2-epimerase
LRKRVIAVFTGNRAEYGLQYPILRAIKNHSDLEYKLIVSGAHLDSNFGSTCQEIENDGFEIYAEVKIEMDANSLFSTAQAIGSGIIEISKVLATLRPDFLIVYADRFEGFAAVIAASQMNVPTAHIEGGDLTEGGALDDSVRHAMTKLSHLHFTTNDQATNRIMGLGEEPWRVHTVGFPAIDLIAEGNYASKEVVLETIGLDPARPIVLFTQHSVTTEFDFAGEQILSSLKALEQLAKEGVQVVVTYPNNDAGGKAIIDKLVEFDHRSQENIFLRKSLGRYLYHGVLALALHQEIKIVCLGNSSSGIKETPAFGCPTVNIGSRQDGRLRGQNVIEVGYLSHEIYEAVKEALHNERFREICREAPNPYWLGESGPKIARILADTPIDQRLIRKKMTLTGEVEDGWHR